MFVFKKNNLDGLGVEKIYNFYVEGIEIFWGII